MSATTIITELFQAAKSGDADKLEELLAANPGLASVENEDGLTLLGFAAHFGRAQAVRVILDHGADIQAISHSKISFIPANTALHAAIAGERDMDVIRLLLERGAKTDLFDSNGHTSLHTAAFHDDNTRLVQMLLAHGADPAAKVEGGKTALELAQEQGNEQVAALLRQNQ